MNKALAQVTKLAAAASGPACIFYATKLFEEFFSQGKEARDSVHTVLVNNHGAYRYITESQHDTFRLFLVLGVVLLIGLLASIVIAKLRARRGST